MYMTTAYNQYNLEAGFKNYLCAENIQAVSLKNYLSDIRYFFGWLTLSQAPDILSGLTQENMKAYRAYLESNQIPHSTSNRRLSTVRKFCKFCLGQNWITTDPTKYMQNMNTLESSNTSKLVNNYKNFLSKKGLSIAQIDEKVTDVLEVLRISL